MRFLKHRHQLVLIFLLVLGLMQMAGELLHLRPLAKLGFALNASPGPGFFFASPSYEGYFGPFELQWRDWQKKVVRVPITPDLYEQRKGPFLRRHVYDTALAFGPVLNSNPTTKPLFESITTYGFCGDRPVLREMGYRKTEIQGDIWVQLQHPLRFRIDCKK